MAKTHDLFNSVTQLLLVAELTLPQRWPQTRFLVYLPHLKTFLCIPTNSQGDSPRTQSGVLQSKIRTFQQLFLG